MSNGLFKLDATASNRRRKTRRASFGTHVLNQTEHLHRTRCVIYFLYKFDAVDLTFSRPV